MSHPVQNISHEDIRRYRQNIENEGTNGIIKTYEELEQKRYRYATLANSVIKKNSPAGIIALEHMNTIAQTNWGRSLTKKEIDTIYQRTVYAYLEFLDNQIDENQTSSKGMRDISYNEAQSFHDKIFEEINLGKEAWTLYLPLKLMTESEKILYWEEVLNSAGSNLKEAALAAKTTFNVLRDGIS